MYVLILGEKWIFVGELQKKKKQSHFIIFKNRAFEQL